MLVTKSAEKSLKGLVHHVLEHHHEPTKIILEEIKQLLRRAASENLDNPLLNKLGMAFQSLAMTMHMHMEKEEQVLFPMFQRLEDGLNVEKHCGSIANPISIMEYEHKELDLFFERIHQLTGHYQTDKDSIPFLPRIYDLLIQLEADLKVHSQLEESELFPLAVKLEKAPSDKKIFS